MLSLGRKEGQYIMIGDDIMIQVIDSNGSVRLGIAAPDDLPILRGELYEQRKAAQDVPESQRITKTNNGFNSLL